MPKPFIICHMGSTVDGRIIGEHWGDNSEKYGELYEKCHDSFETQAWMVGRVTMEKDFTEGRPPEKVKSKNKIPRTYYLGDPEASSFAIALDPSGKLGWESNEIEGDHVIEILSENVSDDYLQYFRGKKVFDYLIHLSFMNKYKIFVITHYSYYVGGTAWDFWKRPGEGGELDKLILIVKKINKM